MEETAPNEQKQDANLPSLVKLAENSAEDNNKDKEVINSNNEVDQSVTSPASESKGTVDNCIANSVDNADSVHQSVDNQTVTVNYDENNQGEIDQEMKCVPLDSPNDDHDISQAAAAAVPSSSGESSVIEGTEHLVAEEHCDNGKLSSKPDDNGKVDPGIQPEKEDETKQVPKEDNVGKMEATTVVPTETQLSAQIIDKESPEGGDNKTKVLSEEAEKVVYNESQPSTQLVDKESPEGQTITNTNSTAGKEEESSLDHPKVQRKEASLSAETSEVAEVKPETTGDDEAVTEEKQLDCKEDSQPHTTWHTGDGEEQNTKQGTEECSTSVAEDVSKPQSSTSDESKKPAKATSSGSVFKKMSFGSLFKRKKSIKDKPDVTAHQQAVAIDETQVHDGTDGVLENQHDKEESTATEDAAEKNNELSEKAVRPSEPLVEKPQGNGLEMLAKEEEKEDIPEGAIVPLEEGVAENDEEATKASDETPPQDELEDDIETPTDEDSVLRERIAKRESTTSPRSPTKHMQMRMSYAEGAKEVEVIGEVSSPSEQVRQKSTNNNRLSCRELGEVDHEGWLTKRGGGLFATWKRKWAVLKEQKLYYYKTAFDPEAGGVVPVENKPITAAPEIRRKFCFKIDAEDPKPHKIYLAADSQEDMDKWLSVLASASRGETIVRKTENQQSGDTKIRKKTNSSGQRSGSLLGLPGLGGLGELEKTDQIRGASFGSPSQETQNNIVDKKTHNESVTEDATLGDIQKLMTVQASSDNVDAPVAMETSSTAPLNEESCAPEVVPTVAAADSTVVVDRHNMESSSETQNEECQPEIAPLEQVDGSTKETMETTKASQSETEKSSGEQNIPRVTTPSEQPQKSSYHTDPPNTTWYYALDSGNNDWIDLDDCQDDSDELLSLVRSIKDARVSIIGTPLPGNQERARALTNVSKQNSEVLKLREMKRTLKDKQRDLLAMEELLTNDINRQSINEWQNRYSYLTSEQDAIDENEIIGEKNDSTDDTNKGVNGVDVQGGGEVRCGEAEGNRTNEDTAKVELINSGNTENIKVEHGDDARDGGEVDSAKPDGEKCPDVEPSHECKTEDGGEPPAGAEPEDTRDVQDHVETQEESPQDCKVEESGDVSIPANTKDASLVEEEVADESTNKVDSEKEAIQEERTPEESNNTESSQITKEEQTEDSPENKGIEDKPITTNDTVTLQEQDNVDTRL